jgi:hypothetical protein
MTKETAQIEVDKVIEAIPEQNKENKEIWCSVEIYNALDNNNYRGFKIRTNPLMPKQTMYHVKGSLFF